VVLLATIGAWVYTSSQQMAQKNKELQQQKQLKEYEQQQINERASKDRQCEEAQGTNNSFLKSTVCR